MVKVSFNKIKKIYKQTKEEVIHWVTTVEDLGIFKHDEEVLSLLFHLKAYACIESINWKHIFISLPNIWEYYRESEDLIRKIVYSTTHELIHSFIKSNDEDLVHSLTYHLNGKNYWYCIPEAHRTIFNETKIPIIDIE